MAAANWCTIECDPGVFTELMGEMGVKGAQVEELYSLDPHVFDSLRPIYGLIFLFKWAPDIARSSETLAEAANQAATEQTTEQRTAASSVFFASQVINNACATQAILSVLLNLPDNNNNTIPGGVDIGQDLRTFRAFVSTFPPEMKGLAISNSETIRRAHNSFARPEHFELESDKKKQSLEKDEDAVYHFIAFVPVNGVLYEMDGLQPGPVALGDCSPQSGKDWLDLARPAIQRRIERYSRGEIRFNLMAVVGNKKQQLTEELSHAINYRATLPPDSTEARTADAEVARLGELIAHEEEKLRAWHAENVRRKHNFIPFIANLLKSLAESGHLEALLKKASEQAEIKTQQKQQQQQQKQSQSQAQAPKAPEPMQE